MKKILNDPKQFVVEMLDGLLKAHPSLLDHAATICTALCAAAPSQR